MLYSIHIFFMFIFSPICSCNTVRSIRVYKLSDQSKCPVRILSCQSQKSSVHSSVRSISSSLWPRGVSFEQQVISSAHSSEIGCRHHRALLTLWFEAMCVLARKSHGWLGDPQLLESYTNISSFNWEGRACSCTSRPTKLGKLWSCRASRRHISPYLPYIFHKCRYILYELKIFHFLTSLSWQLNWLESWNED